MFNIKCKKRRRLSGRARWCSVPAMTARSKAKGTTFRPPYRAIAVARALALLGGGAAGACGGSGADEGPAASGAPDAAPDDAPGADAGDGGEASAADASGGLDAAAHACVSYTQDDVPCDDGATCLVREANRTIECRFVDAGLLHPCGDITCGWDCSCLAAETSTCTCYVGAGPLAPPDLPVA